MVLNARQDEREGRIDYWLKIIESFGGDSPVIVVLNHSDEHRLDIDRRGLQKKYPSRIRAFIETSCTGHVSGETSNGIDKLLSEITSAIDALAHIRDPLLVSWFAVKEQLEAMKESYIPHDRYLAMCTEQKISERADQNLLIRLLHDLGIVIHYGEDRHLQETNILNPDWVTAGIYRILNAHSLFQSKGVLAAIDLDSILDSAIYPPKTHDFLLGMMRKFELCFRFEGEDDTYLVPELLQKEEPDLLDESESLGFEYHYPVLPNAVISRFIVRMHAHISKKTYWRTGVVLSIDGNKAVVKADLDEARITIAIRGPKRSRRSALSVIRSHLDHIHHTIPGLNPKQKIPVPGQACAPVDYAHLLKLEEKRHETFLPEGAEDEVSVRRLLDGIETADERHDRKLDRRRERPPAQPTSRPLTPEEQQQLCAALLDAFRSFADLKQLLRFGLGENLEALAGQAKLETVVFELTEQTEARGTTAALLAAALEARPQNPKLLAFAARRRTPTNQD